MPAIEHSPVLRAGTAIGDCYTIIDFLGKGVSAKVYSAIDCVHGRKVAVKHFEHWDGAARQCRREVSTMRKLTEADKEGIFVPQLIETFVKDGRHVIIMEFVEGRTLKAVMAETRTVRGRRDAGLDMHDIRKVMSCLVRTFEFLESNGIHILHGDVKPDNIVLTEGPGGDARLIDYGLAYAVNTMEKNMYIQSRWYRSPEVLLGIPATHAIDVWSAGVVLVELFSGFVPFRGDSSFDQMEQIVNAIGGPPPSMRARCEAITLEKLDEISDNATYDFEVSPSATGSRKGRHEEDMEDKPPSSESKHDRFIRALSCVRPLRDGETQQEMEAAVDLASRMLVLEPLDRISSSEAAFHAFLQPPSPKASNAPVPPSPKGISPKKSVKYEDRLALLSLNKGVEKSSGAGSKKTMSEEVTRTSSSNSFFARNRASWIQSFSTAATGRRRAA